MQSVITRVGARALASRDYAFGEGSAVWAVLALSVASGVAVAIEPLVALAPLVVLATALLLVDGRARIVFVVFGGLLVLQRGQDLDVSKAAFLALSVVAFAAAFLNVRSLSGTPPYRVARPLMTASVALACLAAVSLAVAHYNATPLVGGWLRDMAPYVLFVAAPIFALDAQQSLSRRALVALLAAAGTLGALSFAVLWLQRRGIVDFGGSQIGLASPMLPAALFAFAMSAALQARRNRWLALAAIVLALLLVTGTRTNLVLLVAPLAIALGARRQRASRSIRLVVLGPLAIAITLAVSFLIVNLADANMEALGSRLDLIEITGTSSDASYVERSRQTEVAWETFKANPVLGAGPGTTFVWERINGEITASFTMDTPLTFLAKFGLVGIVALLVIVSRYWRFTRSLARDGGPTVEKLALVGYLAVAVAIIPANSPLEDKGFSLGLMLLLALALSGANAAHTSSASAVYRRVPLR